MFAKKEKESETLIEEMSINSKDGVIKFGIHYAYKEKRETTYARKNRTTKPRKDQNPRRKGMLEADTN